MKLTMEQAERLYSEAEGKPDLFYSEINTLTRWADSKESDLEKKLHCAAITAFNLGARRGRAYEKAQQKKRFTLTPEEMRQAEAIAKAWKHDECMSEVMTDWDAEDVARVLLDAALTEETERQRSVSSPCGITQTGGFDNVGVAKGFTVTPARV